MARSLGTVLLTGGAGFIGSNLVHHLLAADPAVRIVTLDALTYAGDRDKLDGLPDPIRHTFVHGDIRDPAAVRAVLAAHDVRTVVHLAAESHVDNSIAGPAVFLETNVGGTGVLLDAVRQAWDGDMGGRRFHHVSTDEVYGSLSPEAPPSQVGDAYAPSSPYSASKAGSDHLVWAWARTWGLPVTVSHCTNNYGPRQHREKFIPVVVRAAAAGQPVPVYGDGQQVRDWLHVADHCEALHAILAHDEAGLTWHIGADDPWRNLDLATLICERLDRRFPAGAPHARHLTHVADRLGHDRRYALDSEATRATFGWRPARQLADWIDETITDLIG